ncbi:MAG: hypothetical protein R3F53_19970 [Gammaproteobacteria bacterium]
MLHPFPSRFLRQVLLVDAALSGARPAASFALAGWPFFESSGTLAAMDWRRVNALRRRRGTARCLPAIIATHGVGVITINMAWALAATGLLVFRWFDPNSFGIAWVLLQVVVVIVFAELQYVAIRRSKELAPA